MNKVVENMPLERECDDMTSGSKNAWPGVSEDGFNVKGLLSVLYPKLNKTHKTKNFYFFDSTILMVLSGKMDVFNSDRVETFEGFSSIGLINQGSTLDYIKEPSEENGFFQSVFITLTPELIHEFQTIISKKSLTHILRNDLCKIELNQSITDSLSELLLSLDRNEISYDRLKLKVFDLLIVLSENGFNFSIQNQSSTFHKLSNLFRGTPEQNWTAADAATVLAMSESTLRRRLREENKKFEEVLLEIRMQHALMLVQTTNWSVVKLADACGYKSSARFTERFKDRFGLSPARY